MEISIIVPVYNVEEKIEICLDSVLNQEFKDFELILVDDGSTDGSYKICEKYAKEDSRIVLIHKENGGASAARNEGLKVAKGKYISFLDSDDYVSPTSLKRMYEAIKETDSQLVIGGYYFEKEGEMQENYCELDDIRDNDEFKERFPYLYEKFFINPLWNKLFVRNLIKKEFRTEMNLGEDLAFNLEYMKNIDKVAIVKNIGYHYIINKSGSLTSIYRENAVSIAVLLAKITNKFCEKKFGEEVVKDIVAKRCIDDVIEHIYLMYKDKSIKDKVQILENTLNKEYLMTTDFSDIELTKNQRIIVDFMQKKKYKMLNLHLKLITSLK